MTRSLCVPLTLLLLAVGAGSAAAQTGGTATLVLDGPAARALERDGTRLSASAGAAAFERRAVLRVSGGSVASASVATQGVLTLRRRPRERAPRALTLAAVQVRLGARPSVTALVAGRRRTVLTAVAPARARLNATTGAARLPRTRMRLARAVAPLVRRALGVRTLAAGHFATLSVDAELGRPPVPVTGPAPGQPPAAGQPAAVGGRPATAVDVQAATVSWHIRDSFVQYLQGGEGIRVSGGAVAGPPTVRPGSDTPLLYDVALPFASGWYDPVGDTAELRLSGAVSFSYAARGIDYTTSDAVVELPGAGSRATFAFVGRAGAPFDGGRGTLVDLQPDRAVARGVGPDGRTRTFDQIPATVPADSTASVFAGFYFAGDPYGWWTIAFTPVS